MYAQVSMLNLPRNISNMTIVDSGNIRVLYALNAVEITKPATYDDLQCLEIGSYISKYYSYFTYKSDSLCTGKTEEWKRKHPNAQNIPNCGMEVRGKDSMWSEHYWSEYFKNFDSNILHVYVDMPILMSNYFYSENIPIQEWELYDDTLNITGHLCQKAMCSFRGRHFTAWFTPEIPVNNGPWKFGGLPGLILKIYDEDKLYVYECVGIEHYKKKYLIEMFDYKEYVKTDRKKLWNLQKDMHENITKVIPGLKFYSSHDINNLGLEQPPPKFTYRPLELE